MRPRLLTADNRVAGTQLGLFDDASMRPRLFTADNEVLFANGTTRIVASMRPRLFAADNTVLSQLLVPYVCTTWIARGKKTMADIVPCCACVFKEQRKKYYFLKS